MEGEFIIMAIVMLIGQIILMMMWQNNWFKKENFKIQKSNMMAQNKLQLRKLEREMGLSKTKDIIKEEPKGTLASIADLLPLLKNLDADQVSALADRFIGGSAEAAEGGGSSLDGLIDFASENPDLVRNFIEGIGSGKKPPETKTY